MTDKPMNSIITHKKRGGVMFTLYICTQVMHAGARSTTFEPVRGMSKQNSHPVRP